MELAVLHRTLGQLSADYAGAVTRWIELQGLVNLRDLGGLPTEDGATIAPRRLLRSDNLQQLTRADLDALARLGLSDVIDLRSDYEDQHEGPGPIIGTGVTVQRFSMFRENAPGIGEAKPDVRSEVLPEQALPWVDLVPDVQLEDPVATHYFGYLADRPDSVLSALRTIGNAPGAALVHCAAGKDRTGTVVALALSVAGVQRDQIVADYALTSERVSQIIDRLMRSETYAPNLIGRPVASHMTHARTMVTLLDHIDTQFGGVEPMLLSMGWTTADSELLRTKLLAA